MNTPNHPLEPPPTRGVRRRIERSLPAVRAASGFGEVLNEAAIRRWGDKLERARREQELSAELGERRMSLRELFASVGSDIEERREQMVEADAALERARERHRRCCRRRDRAARRLYRELGRFRKSARDLLGPDGVRRVATLEGPTLRNLRDGRSSRHRRLQGTRVADPAADKAICRRRGGIASCCLLPDAEDLH